MTESEKCPKCGAEPTAYRGGNPAVLRAWQCGTYEGYGIEESTECLRRQLSACQSNNEILRQVQKGHDREDVVCRICGKDRLADKHTIAALREVVSRLHPRVFRLIEKGREFIVIGIHEPYYRKAYELIRQREQETATWTEQDEECMARAVIRWHNLQLEAKEKAKNKAPN